MRAVLTAEGEGKMLFETMPAIGQKEVEEGLRFASEQILRNLGEFTEQFQDCASQGCFISRSKTRTGQTASGRGKSGLRGNIAGISG